MHSNADQLSRRPCYSQECAYREKDEYWYGEDLLLEEAHPVSRQPPRPDLNEEVGVKKIVDWPETMVQCAKLTVDR